MPTNAPAVDRALRAYARSLDFGQLNNEAKEVVQAIRSNAYNDCLEELRLLFVKITLKSCFLEFFATVSTAQQRDEIVCRIQQTNAFSKKYGFVFPVEMGERILSLFERFFPYLREREIRRAMLAGQEDDPSSVNVSEIEAAIVKIEAEEGTVAAFPAEEIFEPAVKTIEYRSALLEQLRADKERWIALLEKKKRAADKELLAKYLIPLDEKYRLVFDYVPDGDPFYERANALILHTPIAEEAALVIEEYEKVSGVSFSLLNLRTVADDFTKDLPELFRVVAMQKIHLLLEGIGDFLLRFSEEEAGKILIDLIRIGKSGCKIVLLDRDGKNGLYDLAVRSMENVADISILDISYCYLSMPKYDDLLRLFVSKNLLDSVSDPRAEQIKAGMPFMGFAGLNEVLRAAVSGRQYLDVGHKISERNNTSLLRDYLARIPNLSLFIDSGWGSVCERKESALSGRPDFDYDAIRNVKPENIRKIVNFPCDYFAKAGLIVRYCMLGGDSVERWKDMDGPEQERRAMNAVDLLFQLFGIGFAPKVEITEEMGSRFADGVCIDGGKIIRLKKSCLSNYPSFSEIILHECFHAFQRKAIDSPYCKWFWTELGVKPERIAEWSLNSMHYISPEKTEEINKMAQSDINFYRLQIFETEAYAFSKDAVRSADEVWSSIPFD